MTLEIKTEIIIKATPNKIWSILTNFNEYPKWNPFITSIKGNLVVCEKIIARIEPPDSNAMTFKPEILSVTELKEFSWLGHLTIPGLFDGNHKFELLDNNDGTTTFFQSEIFNGVLVFLFKKQLNTNTKNGFVLMNRKLKELAEK